MSKLLSVKECDIFTKVRKTSSRNVKAGLLTERVEVSSMADLGEVLTEQKVLCSKFPLK